MPEYKLGQICIHGQLARQCPICERDAEIERLRAECFKLAAGLCIHPTGVTGNDGGTPVCPLSEENERLRKEVEELIDQNKYLMERLDNYE